MVEERFLQFVAESMCQCVDTTAGNNGGDGYVKIRNEKENNS